MIKPQRPSEEELLDRITDSIIMFDTDWHFISMNAPAEKLFDKSSSDLLGKRIWDVYPESADSEFYDYYHEAMDLQEQQHFEGYYEPWDQWYEEHLYPSPDGLLVISRDITERKELEQKLQHERDCLDEFAGAVSHNLRNPLNVAQGQMELAMEECNSKHLNHVVVALDRMDTLIDNVLRFAQEDKQVKEWERVDLAELSETCWRTVATAEATLITEVDHIIQANRPRLQQLLENLIQNAVEHGGNDVTVTIGGLKTGFYVEDDGPGIPSEKREQVLDTGYSTTERGTGFGLGIVKQIATAHDWEISVTTGTQGGARFEISHVIIDSDQSQ